MENKYEGCKEVVFGLINERSAELGSSYTIEESRLKDVEKICEMLDLFVTECNVDELHVSINDSTNDLIFILVSDEVIVGKNYMKSFISMVRNFDSFRVFKIDNDTIQIEFSLPKLWKK